MLEAQVESYLSECVETRGGFCIKLNPLWYKGIPDRLVLLPDGRLIFIELKRPVGGRKSKMQRWWRENLMRLGFSHCWCHTLRDVDVALA